MQKPRNELEQVCFVLARSFTRVENILSAAPYLDNPDTHRALTGQYQKRLERFAATGLGIRKDESLSKQAASNALEDTAEAINVASLILWHTAVEEYCFSLLQLIAKFRPDTLQKTGKFTPSKLIKGDTRSYKLVECYEYIVSTFLKDNNVNFNIKISIKLIKEMNRVRRSVVHYGEKYRSEYFVNEFTWELHRICFDIAQCLASELKLEMNLNRLLID